MIETHRSFANTWECDENKHINVQFFFKRFEEAREVFVQKTQTNITTGLATTRHVRFHKEVHAGDSLKIDSGVIASGDYSGALAHRMINSTNGELCTTALDFPMHWENVPEFSNTHLGEVIPRGLPSGNIPVLDTDKLLRAGEAMITNYTILRRHDLDHQGNFLSSRIISMFTDGAPHIWEGAGVHTQWLNKNNFGRVAVELNVSTHAKPQIGNALMLISRVNEIEGRTFRIDHQIETVKDRKVIASGSVRCLVMDLKARKAVFLPDSLSTKLNG